MNEELKIIISAVTSDAKKGIQGVNKELSGMQGAAAKGGKAIGTMVKGITTSVAVVLLWQHTEDAIPFIMRYYLWQNKVIHQLK